MSSTIQLFDVMIEAHCLQWAGADPASNGWTKHGSGTTSSPTSGQWEINTPGSNAATYYTHDLWVNNQMQDGLTLVVGTPIISSNDGSDLPNNSVIVVADDGTHRFEITWDSTFVYLNGGAGHGHSGLDVTLVVAPGGATADLYIGPRKVETARASIASTGAGLFFGDLATTDDSDVIWDYIVWSPTAASDGLVSLITGATVKLFDATLDAPVSTETDSDNDAIFPPITVAVDAGTLVRGRIENFRGAAGYAEWRSY